MTTLNIFLLLSAFVIIHESNGMQLLAQSIRTLRTTATKPTWPHYTAEQKEKLAQLTVARLKKEFPIKSSNHPVQDERELRKFINQVAKEICPGPEEYSTGHQDHQCLRCGPARRGALPEVKRAFRL